MTSKKIFLVMLVIILTFGLTIIGCDNDQSGRSGVLGLNGTWYSAGNVYKYYFNNGNYEHSYNGNPYRKGTYTTTTDSITMTVTHIGSMYSSYVWLDSKTWYSRDDFKTAYLNYYRQQYRTQLESQLQQTYDTYVSLYGVSTANQLFLSTYGTTNIDSIIKSQLDLYMVQFEQSIDASSNSFFPAPSTVAFSLSGNTLYIGGVKLTRN